MTSLNIDDVDKMREFLKWRRNNPEEYKEFMGDLKSFSKDMWELQ